MTRRWLAGALVVAALAVTLSGCSTVTAAVPRCGATEHLGLVAESVPSASYVPCLNALPAGWSAGGFDAASGHTRFWLLSDRADGKSVTVELRGSCNAAGATPIAARSSGVRTSILLAGISPRYAGTLFDVFAGGCITYRFDFPRGPHIGLMEDLQTAVALYPRLALAAELHRQLGVSIGP